jgi:hypothetical protein
MITGKGYFIWQLDDDQIPQQDALARMLTGAGFSHVIIKVADGPYAYNADLLPTYVEALQRAGIQVWGFQYIYLDDPINEARKGIRQVLDLGLAGLIIDAEGECKGKAAAAERYMKDLRAGLPGVLLGLSSYRWPSLHPEFPWREMLAKVDFVMPQVYWVGADNPAGQLDKSMREYAGLAPAKPYIPTGAAYQERGWEPTPAQIVVFFQAVKAARLLGCNFWELANSLRYGLYSTVAGLNWDGTTPPIPEPDTKTILLSNPYSDRMNFRIAPAVSTETVQGQLLDGTLLEVLEEVVDGQDIWLRVRAEGWIVKRYQGRVYVEDK